MTEKEYQWHINLVKQRYPALNLTFEQAEQVYRYEQETRTYSLKHSFSVWEEWDYELTTFRQILDTDQIRIYENNLAESVKSYENDLVEQDSERTNKIEYYNEILNYYENIFLPDFFKDPFLSSFIWLNPDKAKIEFLRAEYKSFLNDTKKAILTNHFRYYRSFKPNELKESLLQHKLCYLWPNYLSFKYSMDEATKAVDFYIKNKIKQFPETTEALVTNRLAGLKTFNESNFKKYHQETKGWHFVIGQLTSEEEREHRVMTLLLLDKDRYGY